MLILESIEDMRECSERLRREGRRIGLVPTMGFLHQGHLSLIDLAKRNADFVIVTIFVNPTQFGLHEDLARYPRDIERDTVLLREAGANAAFIPNVREMYPDGFRTSVLVEGISHALEGMFRPTHFSGVATIVLKLFHICLPHAAVFGQKDAQQTAVLQRMVRDLDLDVELIVAPTLRDADGLALSSRNSYLSSAERKEALLISRSLFAASALYRKGERRVNELIQHVETTLAQSKILTPDYVAIVHSGTFERLETLNHAIPAAMVVAARIGNVRLIDNLILNEHFSPS